MPCARDAAERKNPCRSNRVALAARIPPPPRAGCGLLPLLNGACAQSERLLFDPLARANLRQRSCRSSSVSQPKNLGKRWPKPENAGEGRRQCCERVGSASQEFVILSAVQSCRASVQSCRAVESSLPLSLSCVGLLGDSYVENSPRHAVSATSQSRSEIAHKAYAEYLDEFSELDDT
jgi:hypothetical protein